MRKITAILLFAVMLTGCVNEIIPDDTPLYETCFHAGWDPDTKTVLQDDGSVWWSPGDEVMLFIDTPSLSGSYKMTSTNTVPAEKTDFVCEIPQVDSDTGFTAIYPYDETVRWNGYELFFSIPMQQYAQAGNFSRGQIISIAHTTDRNLYFKILNSAIRFTVSNPDIEKLTLTGRHISGSATYDRGSKSVARFMGSDTIEVMPLDGDTFEVGKSYYISIMPGMLNDDLTLTYHKRGKAASLTLKAKELKPAHISRLLDMDKDLEFVKFYNTVAILPPGPCVLPSGVDKSAITSAVFHVKNDKTTETSVCFAVGEGTAPVYFEQIGTEAHFYTSAEAYREDDPSSMFQGWNKLESLDMGVFDVSRAEDFSYMFEGCSRLKSLDLSSFDNKVATTYYRMFYRCESLKEIKLGEFQSPDASQFSYMFYRCRQLVKLDFNEIVTAGAVNFSHTFAGCSSLTGLDLSNCDTRNVTSMAAMFQDCKLFKQIDLSGFNTSKVTDMTSMFAGCSSLTSIDVSSFDTGNVEYMGSMFGSGGATGYMMDRYLGGCNSLVELDLSNFVTEKVVDLSGMFSGAVKLKKVRFEGWNTSGCQSFNAMFVDCASLSVLDLSGFDTSSASNFGSMFGNCYSLSSLDISSFRSPSATDLSLMFENCISLKEINLSGLNSTGLNMIERMVSGCGRLQSLDIGSSDLSSADVNNFVRSLSNISSHSRTYVAVRCSNKTRSQLQQAAEYNQYDLSYILWVSLDDSIPDMSNYNPRTPDMYYSSDFSRNGEVRTVQTASIGDGVELVLMGDAYSDRLISDGTYDSDMMSAIEGLFSYEPMKSYRDYFNIHIVYVVSENESTAGNIAIGFPNSRLTSSYAKLAVPHKSNSDIATLVIGHDPAALTAYGAAGITATLFGVFKEDGVFDYGQAKWSFSYIPKRDGANELFKRTVAHEFGHTFAKLYDEYSYQGGNDAPLGGPSDKNSIQLIMAFLGAYKNIEFSNDPSTAKWSRFIQDSRYAPEAIGLYEGAGIFSTGAWKPSANSIMNEGDYFDAVSREAIYYRINKLAFGKDWQYDFETFVQGDLKNIHTAKVNSVARTKISAPGYYGPKKPYMEITKSTESDGKDYYMMIME